MNDDGYFDDAVAARYDDIHGGTDPAVIAQTVGCLLTLAEGGDILEFAVGTGRIALSLIDGGASVKGIELSKPMLEKLREKETRAPMDVAIGDMTSTRVEGAFSLVFLVFNTLDNVTTQAGQVACFENAARHLVSGGRFVVETQVPPVQKIPFGEFRHAFASSDQHFGVDEIDIADQTYTSNHVWMAHGQHTHLSIPFRYAWPSELDLMAQIAGLALEHRWSDWDRAPFDRMSTKHISVWRKP
ncbi:class I SAM-dependent methyltransferase [uncultured Tateyamaria sp.]|uniref:class I SAM-dependent methyltransferase n=1 Tax=uncultured Tateyamaria sp. TaxID=455651 RepID=UPI0026381F97|nr:class I SAM-dependent methyltransferase [uncultured Tateyamaria sp.]